jgi:hypothetical protein
MVGMAFSFHCDRPRGERLVVVTPTPREEAGGSSDFRGGGGWWLVVASPGSCGRLSIIGVFYSFFMSVRFSSWQSFCRAHNGKDSQSWLFWVLIVECNTRQLFAERSMGFAECFWHSAKVDTCEGFIIFVWTKCPITYLLSTHWLVYMPYSSSHILPPSCPILSSSLLPSVGRATWAARRSSAARVAAPPPLSAPPPRELCRGQRATVVSTFVAGNSITIGIAHCRHPCTGLLALLDSRYTKFVVAPPGSGRTTTSPYISLAGELRPPP